MGSGHGSSFKCPFSSQESQEESNNIIQIKHNQPLNQGIDNTEESKLERKSAYRFANSSESEDSEDNRNSADENEQGKGHKEDSDGELSIEQMNDKLNEIEVNLKSISNPKEINKGNNLNLSESIELITGLKKILNRKKIHLGEENNLNNMPSTSQMNLIPMNQSDFDKQSKLNKITELEIRIKELKNIYMRNSPKGQLT